MNILTILGSAASYATTLTISAMGIICFGSWAVAVFKGGMK